MTTPAEFRWLLEGEVGLSSMTIWHVLTGEPMQRGWWPVRPQDPDDLRRCVLLLDRFPAWRARLPEVAARYPAWTELVEAWPDLEASLAGEMARNKTGRAPATYALMKEIAGRRCCCGEHLLASADPDHTRNACGFGAARKRALEVPRAR